MSKPIFFILTPLGILLYIYEASVLSYLWAWFIVPTFALPVLPTSVAFGIILLVQVLTIGHTMISATTNIGVNHLNGESINFTNILGNMTARFVMVSWLFFLGWIIA